MILYRASEVGIAGSGDPSFRVLKAVCPHTAVILTRSINMLRIRSLFFRCAWFGLFARMLLLASPTPAQTTTGNLSINFVIPTGGEMFSFPTNIQMIAKAVDSNGTITNVQFFSDGEVLGNGGQVVLDPPGVNGVTGPVYLLTWSSAPQGVHILTAVAYDNQGVTAVSPPVFVAVTPGMTPVVRVTSPANRTVFYAPMDIPITIYARAAFADATNPYSITNVELYAGTNDLGPAQRMVNHGPPLTGYVLLLPYQFSLNLTNVPPGSYAFTAVASDSQGGAAATAPVNITVLAALPPSTSLPDVVSIAATDPVAVAGTNAWFWSGPSPFGPNPSWTHWPPANAVLFTNWGPKAAVFTVTRSGSTSNDLGVAYSVGGTAGNGGDYARLLGSVEIPAGLSSVLIPIVPITDSLTNAAGTVVLTLLPSTSAPIDYVVGPSSNASALMLEDWPRPLSYLVTGTSFLLNAPGPDGAWFAAQSSTNLFDWTALCTNQVFQGSIDFLDPIPTGSAARFYRIVPLSGPPSL